jgi:Fe-S-cluster containining protein
VDRYRRLLGRLDAWFGRGRERHPGVIPCAAGCSDCCRGPFDVSVADMALLLEGLERLAPGARDAVLSRARAQLERARALESGWEPPFAVEALGEERFDALGAALHEEPCPFLDEAGGCRVYEERPLVCRLIGLSMRTPAGRTIENTCPIQGRFPGYAALPPLEFDLEGFEEEERTCLREAAAVLFGDARFSELHSFVAGALVALEGRAATPPAPAKPPAAGGDKRRTG